MKNCIILANGQAPSKKTIEHLSRIGFYTLICADGGANTAYKLGLVPDIIIGDLDSIDNEVYNFYARRCKILKVTRQNDTDVEKCLKYAVKHNYTEAVLLGATGDRLDHSFCNLGIVLKFFDRIKIRIIHQKSILYAYMGSIEFATVPGETISLYGVDGKTKFKSEGLKYQLKNIPLPFGQKESTSNVAVGPVVKLKITGGKAFVIRDYETLKKNGLV